MIHMSDFNSIKNVCFSYSKEIWHESFCCSLKDVFSLDAMRWNTNVHFDSPSFPLKSPLVGGKKQRWMDDDHLLSDNIFCGFAEETLCGPVPQNHCWSFKAGIITLTQILVISCICKGEQCFFFNLLPLFFLFLCGFPYRYKPNTLTHTLHHHKAGQNTIWVLQWM